jgi:hypothetical protein
VTGDIRPTSQSEAGLAITHRLVPVMAFVSSEAGCLSLAGGLPGLLMPLADEAEAEDLQP